MTVHNDCLSMYIPTFIIITGLNFHFCFWIFVNSIHVCIYMHIRSTYLCPYIYIHAHVCVKSCAKFFLSEAKGTLSRL